jgi:hypothetical protein
MNSRELGRLPLYAQSDFVNYIQPFSTDNNMWDPTPLDSCLPLFYASLAGPSMDGIAPEGLPANFSMNELYYNQMASVFSGWKGPVPELPYEQPTIPAPYQYHTSQSVPLPDEHIPSPSDASVRNVPVQWEPLPVV